MQSRPPPSLISQSMTKSQPYAQNCHRCKQLQCLPSWCLTRSTVGTNKKKSFPVSFQSHEIGINSNGFPWSVTLWCLAWQMLQCCLMCCRCFARHGQAKRGHSHMMFFNVQSRRCVLPHEGQLVVVHFFRHWSKRHSQMVHSHPNTG